MVRVIASAPVRPTEVAERVEAAVTRFFPGDVERSAGGVRVTGHDLRPLRERVWELRIIDTFRGAVLRGADGARSRFHISKQAAAAGKVSLPPARHSLGDIEVVLEVENGDPWADAEALAWWLCPETAEGEIVGPTD